MSGASSDDVGRVMSGFGAYCAITADLLGLEMLALFVYSPKEQVHFAFMLNPRGIAALMLPEDAHRRGRDAIQDAEVLEDRTAELDRDLDGDETLTGENMSAWIGGGLKDLAVAQQLEQAALFIAQGDGGPQLAFKYHQGTLWAGAGEHGTFSAAFNALTEIDIARDALPITDLVREAMGDDFPNWISEDDRPAERPALTPEQLSDFLRPDDPDFPDDPWAPTDGVAWINIPGPDARRVRMTKGAKYILDKQRERFIKKFGREPGEGDPIWFDHESDTPKPMSTEQADRFSDLWDALNLDRTRDIIEARMEEHGMVHRTQPKPRRNDPCPCGSGRKFKKCHGT